MQEGKGVRRARARAPAGQGGQVHCARLVPWGRMPLCRRICPLCQAWVLFLEEPAAAQPPGRRPCAGCELAARPPAVPGSCPSCPLAFSFSVKPLYVLKMHIFTHFSYSF